MAIPGILGKIPPALLPLLELKARGQNPDTLGDMVVPTIETMELYLQADQQWLLAQTQVDANEGFPIFQPWTTGDPMTVPPGELWYVWNFSGSIRNVNPSPAIVQGHFGGAIQRMSAADQYEWLQPMTWTGVDFGGVATGLVQGQRVGFACAPRRFFPAGTQFGYTAGYINFPSIGDGELYMTVTKLKV